MFADVARSTELTEQLDPEACHRTLERYFELLTEGVHRFSLPAEYAEDPGTLVPRPDGAGASKAVLRSPRARGRSHREDR
jgi:hypothetical protein